MSEKHATKRATGRLIRSETFVDRRVRYCKANLFTAYCICTRSVNESLLGNVGNVSENVRGYSRHGKIENIRLQLKRRAIDIEKTVRLLWT